LQGKKRKNSQIFCYIPLCHLQTSFNLVTDVFPTPTQLDVSVCGEMASEPEYVMLLLGIGIRTLSLIAPMIPEIKQMIRLVTMEVCNNVARKVLGMNSERQISNFLRNAARKILPEAF